MLPSLNKKSTELTASIQSRLPEISEKTDAIGRSNSQTTLSMMSLTMLNGQSPYRVARQVLAEIERRRLALAEAQLEYAKMLEKTPDEGASQGVREAQERLYSFQRSQMEAKVSGAIKDIATLISAYDNVAKKYGIEGWTEEDFERYEGRHHVRRSFELLYRDLISSGRAREATIEYMQQFGVHIQLALKEVQGYIAVIEEIIARGERPDSSSIEDFLDEMAVKYEHCVGVAANRLFGVDTVVRADFMSMTNGG